MMLSMKKQREIFRLDPGCNTDLAVRILEINSRSTAHQLPDTLLSKWQCFQIINFSNMLNEKKSNLSTCLKINTGGKVLTMLASAMEGKTFLEQSVKFTSNLVEMI